jgi:cytochrome d ubiquinol oxidase subunit I
MLTLVVWSIVQWRRGVLDKSNALLRAWMLLTPTGFVAVLAGWYTAEIGRQPYVVYGLLRTSEAATAIASSSVLTSLLVFGCVYLFVFTAGVVYLLKLLRRGPQPVDADQQLGFKSASHPMSLPDETFSALK